MNIFLITLAFFIGLMLIMAVGVIFSHRELKGSCGGVNNCICEATGRKIPNACKQIKEAIAKRQAELEQEG